MNPANQVRLEGTLAGDCWTRWKARDRGKVMFWLAVSRELAGDGFDRLLCAIEPKSPEEVYRLERELVDGRAVKLEAEARMAVEHPTEAAPGVLFVAECCGIDGQAPRSAHNVGLPPRRIHAHGKAAAAGDDQPELPIAPLQEAKP